MSFHRLTFTSSRGKLILENFQFQRRSHDSYASRCRRVSNSLEDDTSPPGEIFTDVDLRSTGPHGNEDFDSIEKTRSECTNDRIDDQQSSGRSHTIVPEVSDNENVNMEVENESPRRGK